MGTDASSHWDTVFRTRAAQDLSWFQEQPATSERLVASLVGDASSVVDVGAGVRGLAGELIARGVRDVTVLDISPAAVEKVRAEYADALSTVVADVRSWQPGRTFDIWHDRAVFHFLTEAEDRRRYVATAHAAVRPGGHLVLGTFAADGPTSCSGLPTARYAPEQIAALFGAGFVLEHSERELHRTPAGATQAFTWVVLRRRVQPAAPELAVERWGAGPPVLLLHGIGGSARYWRPLAEVSTGYRAVAPDLLGFGRSPRPEDRPYDVDAHLEALLPLVARGSVVLAHSTGAVLAAALAARRPDLVRALLLVGAPLYADVASARREVRKLGALARFTASGEVAGRVAMVLLHTLVRPLSALLPLGLPPAVVQDFWEHSWTSYSRTLRQVVIDHPAVPDLAATDVPCTLVYGRTDRTASHAPLPGLLAANPALRAVELPGGHHLPAQDPARIAQLLTAQLARG